MSDELKKAVDLASNGEAAGFKEIINSHLTQLANKAIDDMKLGIAKEIGKTEEVETETPNDGE